MQVLPFLPSLKFYLRNSFQARFSGSVFKTNTPNTGKGMLNRTVNSKAKPFYWNLKLMLFSRHWLGVLRLVAFLAGQQGPGNPCIFVCHRDIGDVFSTPLLDVTNPAVPFVRVLVRHSNH
jgi:hypothetical protein